MKDLTYDKLDKIAKMKMSEFAEEYIGVGLLDYQKSLIDNYNPNIAYYLPARGGGKKLINFYSACRHFFDMKDNDVVMVAKPDGYERMTKDEFGIYLLGKYW